MLLDNYSIPSFSGVSRQALTLGIPFRHAFLAILLAGIPVGIVDAVNEDLLGAIALGLLVFPMLFSVLRWLYRRDEHWIEHLTWHRYPNAVWRGD